MPSESNAVSTAVRRATVEDSTALERHIAMSVRVLAAEYHTPDEIDSSLRYLFGVDSTLLRDGTYYVVERSGEILASGGWSRRRTPFGGDNAANVHDEQMRDPETDPAIMRAFFVAPHAIRKGLGRLILARCEAECLEAGFRSAELVATRMGEAFYRACGFEPVEDVPIQLPDGITIQAFRMTKKLTQETK